MAADCRHAVQNVQIIEYYGNRQENIQCTYCGTFSQESLTVSNTEVVKFSVFTRLALTVRRRAYAQ